MDEKTEKIYQNLVRQIDRIFRHVRQGAKGTKYRYKDGVKHFAKFIAEAYKKQNLNKIENKHLEAYIEQMIEVGYAKSYISSNLSAIRFFIDQIKDSSYVKTNAELGAVAKTRDEIIGPNRAWKVEEIKNMQELAILADNERVADMIQVAKDHGFRIHEATRLERVDLQRALKVGYIRIKGKGGLVRDVPVRNIDHLQKLIDKTSTRQAKIFVYEGERAHQVIEMVQQFIYNNREKVHINDGTDRGGLSFHGIRHFWAQVRFLELRQQGLNFKEARKKVSRELGHFRAEITDIYLNIRKDKGEENNIND